MWRGVAKRTFEAVALLARPRLDDAQKRVIGMHAKALRASVELVPKTAREDVDFEQKQGECVLAFRGTEGHCVLAFRGTTASLLYSMKHTK